jgi:hypothetical protein
LTTTAEPASPALFSPRTMLALVAVGLLAFSSLAVLSAYAPDLRSGGRGAHALSASAVGFKGAVVMLKAQDAPVVIRRARPGEDEAANALLVLTPTGEKDQSKEIARFPKAARTLLVLPKWRVAPDPLRKNYVRKVGLADAQAGKALVAAEPKGGTLAARAGVSRPQLRGAGVVFAEGTLLPLGPVDQLQTISGPQWEPLLADETGKAVLAQSKSKPELVVLSDPDLLNTQGLANLDTARAGMAILDALRAGENGVIWDVTLNGFARGRGLGRALLEPPLLSATLCGVLAALLMGVHGLARFGAPRRSGRAFALGKQALVDNSAGLVRMAGREAELAPAYAALVREQILNAAGGERARSGESDAFLADLARLRGAAPPGELAVEAERAKTRDDLLRTAQRLFQWRSEMMRERR